GLFSSPEKYGTNRALTCSSLGPAGRSRNWAPKPPQVQQPGNSALNFLLRCHVCLDKITIWQHPASRIIETADSISVELGQDMRLATGLLAAVLFLLGLAPSHAVVRIADDRGGRIGTYVDKYQGLRNSGEAVIIDGLCASACTIVLGAIPHDRICVTSHATLGFLAAWDFGTNGRAITNPEATQMLYSMYPSPVKRWISARGVLTPHMIFL